MAFQKVMIENTKHNQTKEMVFLLSRKFIEEGLTKEKEERYQTLNTQITQAALAAVKKVAKRKYGYTRNDELVNCGRMVVLYKMTLDYNMRRVLPTTALERQASALKLPLAHFNPMTLRDICREVRKCKTKLWETQKRRDAGRVDWLENEKKNGLSQREMRTGKRT